MIFPEGWRLLPLPKPYTKRRLPHYGWFGLVAVIAAEILLYFQIEPVYTNATPILWIAYIAFIDAWTYKRSGRSFFHPTQLREWENRWMAALMLPFSVAWWLLFEFINCYLENWHYIGLIDNPSRYLGYIISFATIFPGILCTTEWLLTYPIFQDRQHKPSNRLSNRFLWSSLLIGALLAAFPQLLPWREVRWYLFGPVWVGYIFLVEPVLYWSGAPSLYRAWENGQYRSISAYLFSGVICGLLWEFWNYWAGAKWLYTVPFTETIRYFEMPLLGFGGFIPFAWECYALFSLSLLLCGLAGTDRGTLRPCLSAWIVCGGILALCVVTYVVHPSFYFSIENVFSSMPAEKAHGETLWSEMIDEVENNGESPRFLLGGPWGAENHAWDDLRRLGGWLRSTDAEKRDVANRVLRARSIAARFAWANQGFSAEDLQ